MRLEHLVVHGIERTHGEGGADMFDKFREECGVFGIYGHAEAAKLAYLGLYALQHRGQESAGIATADGVRSAPCARWATSTTSSTSRRSRRCPATSPSATRAIRPRARASSRTPSRSSSTACTDRSASATTATSSTPTRSRDRLVRDGSIFQTNSDTEVLVHLYARSQAGNFEEAIVESIAQLSGAFSFAS